ncbi:MAG: hypothetical protein LBG15_14780, partial [Dysgonamonadaceae bacterium]|jgi:uncharacterized protein (TIGR02145 family)|nr:hypothetical protein [Dysgonamonadaceae bacterium]
MKSGTVTQDSVVLNPGFSSSTVNAAVIVSHDGSDVVYTPGSASGVGANYTMNGVAYVDESWDDFADKFGYLYSWRDAMNACPTGWSIPTLTQVGYYRRRSRSDDTLPATSYVSRDNGAFEYIAHPFNYIPAGSASVSSMSTSSVYGWGNEFNLTTSIARESCVYGPEGFKTLLIGSIDSKLISVRCVKN